MLGFSVSATRGSLEGLDTEVVEGISSTLVPSKSHNMDIDNQKYHRVHSSNLIGQNSPRVRARRLIGVKSTVPVSASSYNSFHDFFHSLHCLLSIVVANRCHHASQNY